MSSTPYTISPEDAHHTVDDSIIHCSHCNSKERQNHIGQMSVSGEERPVYHCEDCSKCYSDIPASVKTLADYFSGSLKSFGFRPNKQTSTSVEKVSFNQALQNQFIDTRLLNTGNTFTELANLSSINSHTQSINNALGNTNSTLYSLQNTMRDMLTEIQNLTRELRTVVEKNSELVDRISKDTLSGIREAISSFNLK